MNARAFEKVFELPQSALNCNLFINANDMSEIFPATNCTASWNFQITEHGTENSVDEIRIHSTFSDLIDVYHQQNARLLGSFLLHRKPGADQVSESRLKSLSQQYCPFSPFSAGPDFVVEQNKSFISNCISILSQRNTLDGAVSDGLPDLGNLAFGEQDKSEQFGIFDDTARYAPHCLRSQFQIFSKASS